MLIDKSQFHQLVANYDAYVDNNGYRFLDVEPVVRIFDRKGLCWLFVHMNPEGSFAYGFEDSGNGDPKTGWFELKELASRTGTNGCDQDKSFVADGPIRTYLMAAQDKIHQYFEEKERASKVA